MHELDFVGFVPKRMDIAESIMFHFPQNVVFGKFGTRDGKNVFSTSLYKPDLDTYSEEGEKCSMKYLNAYGGDSWLLITYDSAKKSYKGEKFINGESVGMAFGPEWKMFFVHFTTLGLTNDERCLFSPTK